MSQDNMSRRNFLKAGLATLAAVAMPSLADAKSRIPSKNAANAMDALKKEERQDFVPHFSEYLEKNLSPEHKQQVARPDNSEIAIGAVNLYFSELDQTQQAEFIAQYETEIALLHKLLHKTQAGGEVDKELSVSQQIAVLTEDLREIKSGEKKIFLDINMRKVGVNGKVYCDLTASTWIGGTLFDVLLEHIPKQTILKPEYNYLPR